ncbi:MAG: hypothetical protein AAF669_09115, partial [Pseudomonadota bacterium]
LLSSGNNGFTVSAESTGPGLSWYDAIAYCENLESAERSEPDGPVYTDWRVPNTSEMLTICENDNVYIRLPTDEPELVPLNDQENDLGTMVFIPEKIDGKYDISRAEFCKHPKRNDNGQLGTVFGENSFGLLLRDLYYTYDGFDSKFFPQPQGNPRGNLTTNYAVASSFNPRRSHVIKSPIPVSPEIDTGHTLHVFCVR